MSYVPPHANNDLELWLLSLHRRTFRLEGPAAHEFAQLLEARLRAVDPNRRTAFYVPQWTPEPVVFAAIGPGCAECLAEVLRRGEVDVVLQCTTPSEAIVMQGAPPALGNRVSERLIDLRFKPMERVPNPTTPPSPTQFQALVAAINPSGRHA